MVIKMVQLRQTRVHSPKAWHMHYVRPILQLFFTPLGSALAAAVGYGTWTFAVNVSAGGTFIALRSGVIHACMSFFITYSSVLMMRTVFQTCAKAPLLGAVLAVLVSLSLTYLLLISVHLYIGTPHIAWTLAPGLLPTIGYDALYSAVLYRAAKRRAATPLSISHDSSGDHREQC